jgi:hypothetical protein
MHAIAQNPFALIDEALIPAPYVVSPETKAMQLVHLMQSHHLPIVLVSGQFGYQGVITKEKLEAALG